MAPHALHFQSIPIPIQVRSGPSPIQTPTQTLLEDAIVRTIKIFDIGYITVIYGILGFAIAILIDRSMGTFDSSKADKRSVFVIFLELILQLWIYGVLVYVARNLVELIPFPLDGVSGFQHKRLSELKGAGIFLLMLIWNSRYLQAKMLYLHDRMVNNNLLSDPSGPQKLNQN